MNSYILHVWGEFACFTRPEMKVERVSYDVMTPSAARAVFEAIFWKPAFRWVVEQIDVLEPIRFTTIRRNEVGSKASLRKPHILIEEDRQQRAATLLKNVGYLIHARMEMMPKAGADENPAKLHEMFTRRAAKGQCFMQPYLGCREFPAYFELVEDASSYHSQTLDKDLGFMLHDMDYSDLSSPQPRFFKATLTNGHLTVPHPDSEELVA